MKHASIHVRENDKYREGHRETKIKLLNVYFRIQLVIILKLVMIFFATANPKKLMFENRESVSRCQVNLLNIIFSHWVFFIAKTTLCFVS